jgi:aminoglycoside 3-N-acetyltransferase
MTFYSTADLVRAYGEMGLGVKDVVYVTGNLGAFGFHEARQKAATLRAHLEALQEVIGAAGTVVVPTHSFDLCNTETVFDVLETPSQRGPLTEWVRRQQGAVRQFHPFASLTALGAEAEAICGHCTRHAYGPNTPYDRLLERNAWGVSLGLPPERTCSVIHHLEQVMAVPYRYVKEFLHPVRRGDEVRVEPFYLYVTYRDADLVRDRNVKLFAHPLLAAAVRRARVGMGEMAAYRMSVLRDAAVELMSADIYHWLRVAPERRPYQR